MAGNGKQTINRSYRSGLPPFSVVKTHDDLSIAPIPRHGHPAPVVAGHVVSYNAHLPVRLMLGRTDSSRAGAGEVFDLPRRETFHSHVNPWAMPLRRPRSPMQADVAVGESSMTTHAASLLCSS